MNDHKYVDVTYMNNSTDLTPRPVIFDQYKDSPFIQGDTSDYYMSITRFSINNTTLPVIIPDILTYESGQVPVDGLIYTEYGLNIGYKGTGPIVWSNANKAVYFQTISFAAPEPAYYPKNKKDLYDNEYYHLTSVQSFLYMLNLQLLNAFADLKSSHTAALQDDLPPVFQWNGSTIELLYTDSFSGRVPILYIGMNTKLRSLLSSFDMVKINSAVQPYPSNPSLYEPTIDYLMALDKQPNYHRNAYQISITVNSVSKSIYMNVLDQEVSSVPFWSPIQTIFWTSASLPVSLSANLGTTFTGDNTSNTNVNTTIISDFYFDLTTGVENQGSLAYVASGEYRLFDLEPSIDLKQLTISAWWKDKYGNNHQVKAPYGSGANMKIMFRKKSFGNIV